MKQSLVMTVIGKDRPGLVKSLSAIIEKHGGNWEESRMVQLAGEFAGLLHVNVSAERVAELETALGRLEKLSVTVARAPEETPLPTAIQVIELEVEGQDHPGIVHHVAEVVASRGINIEELETELGSAPMTGQKMFRAQARLQAPKSVDPDELTSDLEELADDLLIEIRVQESG